VLGGLVTNSIVRGLRLLGASQALLKAMGTVMDSGNRIQYERAVASARALVGDKAFERAWQEVRGRSREQAIEYALKESSQ
jgi:hypothetical protein